MRRRRRRVAIFAFQLAHATVFWQDTKMIENADVGQLRVASHKFNRNMQIQSTVQYCVN